MKAHNDVVAKIRDDTFANKSKEVEALHDRIISKQENAAVKREENQLTWVQKLATSTKDKLGRGKKVLEEEASAKQELESKIEIKDVSANLRRDELIQKKVEELTVINDSKLRRGRLSLELNFHVSKVLSSSEYFLFIYETPLVCKDMYHRNSSP